MPRVFLHTRKPGTEWTDEPRDFSRVPAVGEHVATSENDPDGLWYQVTIVVHTPFSGGFDAEVFAEAVHRQDVHARATAAAQTTQQAGQYGRPW